MSVKCTNPDGKSDASSVVPSDDSNNEATPPTPALLVSPVETRGMTDMGGIVSWPILDAAKAGDCNFNNYIVQVRMYEVGGATWNEPKCVPTVVKDSMSIQGSDTGKKSCYLKGLTCNTKYEIRVGVLCSDPRANPDFIQADPVSTTKGTGTCYIKATAPANVVARTRNVTAQGTTSLDLSWVPGDNVIVPNDCEFRAWEVKCRQVGEKDEGKWFQPAGCLEASLNKERGINECTAGGLKDGKSYHFKVRELCTDQNLDSLFASTKKEAKTIEVHPPKVKLKSPRPVHESEIRSRPESVMVMFDVDVVLNAVAKNATSAMLSVCPAGDHASCGCQAGECEDMCFRVAPADLDLSQLIDQQLLLLPFKSPTKDPFVQHKCTYTVTIDEGFLRTYLTPAKLSPQETWTFQYIAPTPELSSFTAGDAWTITSLSFDVEWNQPVEFTCITKPPPIVPVATQTHTQTEKPVRIELGGLTPGQWYSVSCSGVATSDKWVKTNVETRGEFKTPEDENADLKDLQVEVQAECGPTNSKPLNAQLDPPFAPDHFKYSLVLQRAVDFLDSTICASDDMNTDAKWSVKVVVVPSSEYAKVKKVRPAASEGSQEHGSVELILPKSNPNEGANRSETFVFEVVPMKKGSDIQRYEVEVMAVDYNFEIPHMEFLNSHEEGAKWQDTPDGYHMEKGMENHITKLEPKEGKVKIRAHVKSKDNQQSNDMFWSQVQIW
jgi:hypothetical protein